MLPKEHRQKIIAELERIREENEGILFPEKVVEFAQDPESELHKEFDWDDTEAAQKWRLNQARQLIRVVLTIIDNTEDPVRAYVSLTSDRLKKGGGYRSLVDVLDDEQMNAVMLQDALEEMRSFKRKYERLRALAPVWKAMETVQRSVDQQTEQPAA